MIVGLIIGYCVIISIDLPILMKTNNKKKTLIVYTFILLSAFILSILLIIDKAPISPTIIIENIIKQIIGGK